MGSSTNEDVNLSHCEYVNIQSMGMKCFSEWSDFEFSNFESQEACYRNKSNQCKIMRDYNMEEILVNNGPPKTYRRRNTANKKERRRTLSINTAFSSLRRTIPNVPIDTKLSKIKTLKLATSYITYLTQLLAGNQVLTGLDPSGFQPELLSSKKYLERKNFKQEEQVKNIKDVYVIKKGRTGWPEEVWASELK